MKDSKVIVILSFLLLFTASCKTTKHSNRKCDGKKAVKTPMGNM